MLVSGILYLLPALMLAVVLLARRYPGERTLLALRPAGAPRRSHARSRSRVPARRRVLLVLVRGGLLIARFLAVRPPPAFG